MSRGGGKAEVPNVSFPQSLIPKPQDTQLPWLEVSYGEMNEASQILKERVFPKSLGPGGCTVGWVKRWCLDVAPGDEVQVTRLWWCQGNARTLPTLRIL